MSVFSRAFRRFIPTMVLLALLCALTGCSELGNQLQEGGVYLRDLFLNSITRFPEGSSQEEDPQDAVQPTEFVITPPREPELVGTVAEDVNIRSGPNQEYDHLGSCLAGTDVPIYHQILIGDSPWGLTESGWISMNYVLLADPSQAVSTPITGKNCLIVIPDLDVRTGPGWQYPSAGVQMEGYTSHRVYAKSGTWYLLEEGWVSRDGVYLEGTEGARTGTVTGSEVNIRSGPGTQYDVRDVVVRGDTFAVFHQVAVGDKYWGYTSAGWISMSYVKLEKLEDESTADPDVQQIELMPGILQSEILGQWQQASVSADGNSLTFDGTWVFQADGAFQYSGKDGLRYHGQTAAANNSETEGGPEFSGLYTFDGSMLTLFCTADPSVTEEELPYILLLEAQIENGVMAVASGDNHANLYAGTQEAVAALLLGK